MLARVMHEDNRALRHLGDLTVNPRDGVNFHVVVFVGPVRFDKGIDDPQLDVVRNQMGRYGVGVLRDDDRRVAGFGLVRDHQRALFARIEIKAGFAVAVRHVLRLDVVQAHHGVGAPQQFLFVVFVVENPRRMWFLIEVRKRLCGQKIPPARRDGRRCEDRPRRFPDAAGGYQHG